MSLASAQNSWLNASGLVPPVPLGFRIVASIPCDNTIAPTQVLVLNPSIPIAPIINLPLSYYDYTAYCVADATITYTGSNVGGAYVFTVLRWTIDGTTYTMGNCRERIIAGTTLSPTTVRWIGCIPIPSGSVATLSINAYVSGAIPGNEYFCSVVGATVYANPL